MRYVARRLFLIVVTFFGITVLAYCISAMAPGSPLELLMTEPNMSAAEIGRKRIELGLDQPVYVQYFRWLAQLLKGNLGYSFRTSEPVWGMLMSRIGPTLLLTVTATVVSCAVAIPLGIMAAVKPYTLWDYLSSGLAFLAAASPSFFTGLLFIYIFTVKLRILPMGGMQSLSGRSTLSGLAVHLVMPAVVLAMQQIGKMIRLVRSSALEVLKEDYVRTARAKGLRQRMVIVRHVLRNSLIPVVTMLGLSIPFLVGGAVITEQLFNWPGIGSLMVQAINSRDYPVIMGVTVVIAVAVLAGTLLVDLVYGFLDPRIRAEGKAAAR